MPEQIGQTQIPIAGDDSIARGLYLPVAGPDVFSSEFVSLTVDKPVRIGPNTWKLSFSSTLFDVTFSIYKDGQLQLETKNTTAIFFVESGESPTFEVIDTPGGLPSVGFPGTSLITWYSVPDTDLYRVEEFIGTGFTLRRKIKDLGRPYFTFNTRWLEDVNLHRFRVIAVGNNGNESTAKAVDVFMVRHPDPPRGGFVYDGAGPGTVTITQL